MGEGLGGLYSRGIINIYLVGVLIVVLRIDCGVRVLKLS